MPNLFSSSHFNSRRLKSLRAGFTLVELLVVLAIIGILAAILFPVFSKVRENGRTAACSSNLKQLGLGFLQYTQDAGGRFPGPGNLQDWGGKGHWVGGTNGLSLADSNSPYAYTSPNQANVEAGSLYPYIGSAKVYVCPSNADGEDKKLSYSMNCALGALGQSRIKNPTDVVLLVDEKYANDGFFYARNTESTDQLTDDHNGGGNLLFVDGHVKYFGRDNFNLDDGADGFKLKGAGTTLANTPASGTPRFHEPSFGPFGSSYLGKAKDTCLTPAPTPAP